MTPEQKLIKDLQRIEAQLESSRQLIYNARVVLECVHTPASKGAKECPLSDKQRADLKTKFRKSLTRKTA